MTIGNIHGTNLKCFQKIALMGWLGEPPLLVRYLRETPQNNYANRMTFAVFSSARRNARGSKGHVNRNDFDDESVAHIHVQSSYLVLRVTQCIALCLDRGRYLLNSVVRASIRGPFRVKRHVRTTYFDVIHNGFTFRRRIQHFKIVYTPKYRICSESRARRYAPQCRSTDRRIYR